MSLVPYVHLEASLAGRAGGDLVALGTDQQHRLRRVLRLRDGSDVEVADGEGWAAAARLERGSVVLEEPAACAPVAGPRLVLVQAMPKGRRFDEVLRQVTELGVDEVWPVAAARSIPDAGEKLARMRVRWEQVVWASCEQSRRPRRPRIGDPSTVGSLPPAGGPPGLLRLVAHPGGSPLPQVLAAAGASERAAVDEVQVVIGPEGGWTPEEVDVLRADGALVVGMGATVLRTEHAGAAALAAVAALVGRW